MLPENKTQAPDPSPMLNSYSSTMTSFSFQQGSPWGPGDIGTVVFGCIASVLGILTLWIMFRLEQRQSGHAIRSDGLGSRHPRADAAASGAGVALGFLPYDKEANPKATEEYREDAAVSREA
ncbi:hypothetical protein IMSHALPRED_004668 [Imshaugia aleurites]|uniref:Uncharacterized protein n=1 Tax=Imshaugia aleurites TaxID=172621 RepID=A0A8H3F6Q3_9LECA|nr:hypothetical protein IMSHALPRED_004668 [Imshaugia aleurites]